MPGLSQLKQFNKDILSLGDEVMLRSQRGEKPVIVQIPKSIEDKNDSEEFVMGMPEIEAIVQDKSADDDLSDLAEIAGISKKDESKKTEEQPQSFEAPDLSSLLTPMAADDGFGGGMPDLSMFMEPEEAEEIIEESEPEPPSIADMGLEALLGGAGFDGSSVEEFSQEPDNTPSADEEEFYTGGFGDENYVPKKREPPKSAAIIPPVTDDNLYDTGDANLSNLDLEDLDTLESEESSDESGSALSLEELGLGDLSNTAASSESDTGDALDLDDLESPEELSDTADLVDFGETEDAPPEDFGDISDLTLPDDFSQSLDNPLPDLDSSFEAPQEDFSSPELDEGFGSDFSAASGLDTIDFGSESEAGADTQTDDFGEVPSDDFNFNETPSDDFDFNETPSDNFDFDETPSDDLTFDETPTDNISFDETPSDNLTFDETPSDNLTFDEAAADDFNFDETAPGETPDINEEVPDLGMDDFGSDSGTDDFQSDGDFSGNEFSEEEIPIEDFDTSEMEGITFDIPETDAQINPAEQNQDFGFDGQDFEIPGFSDVETAKEEAKSRTILATSSTKKQSRTEEEENLPPNTLSDAQYKTFLKNLSTYPLNVRLAFEDLIVKNEFTDEAEFEVIEKILNKAPARSVATMLEKMLDISIPVPRDFEHRTAEEYEAYKKSLQYQLKNKIVPGIFACLLILVVGFGLFQFGKNCIYIPAKANSLYKQGYAMLMADEYPQSEINYNEATKYKLSKKWSFQYARGYREHKQYLRAEWMYQNILNYFRHDKAAGLEFARMELDDLANYERAEEICRREILDYHINDADGIMLLGDIFLEWGTEKDPEMLEKAREQYATLIQLYKPNLLYQSRMMRYFIRTDNLRNVLQLKELFLPKEKNLSAEDWTELSGYLMDKLYGPLAPSDEYLRTEIEDVRMMLLRAVKLDPKNPIATYNLSRYFIETNEPNAAKESLVSTIDNFKNKSLLKKRDIYKYIDSYRLLGEQYADAEEYLRAQEYYTDGISLYTAERDASGFEGNKQIGVLFADQANIDYFISGDFDNALQNYVSSVNLENDTPSIRYRIGYIQYQKKNYAEALGSFMKAGDGNIKETNLMLAMANTLSLRGDNYAAQGYYEDLIANLDKIIADKGIVLPQTTQEDYDIVSTYLHAANNYGVTLYRLASRTGNSAFNAEAIVQLSQSVRAWDALTRNQETLVRLGGSNLAEENIRYITHPIPDFEPAIYTEIPRILLNTERF